jgi:hypothetical protein
MTSQSEASKHVTSEMCSVLRYIAERSCMAKIGEPWLVEPISKFPATVDPL